jgi:hypothetical protein
MRTADRGRVRYFATPNGRMLTGALLVSGGVLDLVAGTVSDAVGFGLVVLGTIYALTGFFGRRSGAAR